VPVQACNGIALLEYRCGGWGILGHLNEMFYSLRMGVVRISMRFIDTPSLKHGCYGIQAQNEGVTLGKYCENIL
jgi:hypothetical protein